MKARINVTILVMMTGRELIENPYIIQRKIPAQNSENIPADMSFVDRVFQVLITCGRKDIVVRVPAAMPRSVTASIIPIVPLKHCRPVSRRGSSSDRGVLLTVMCRDCLLPGTTEDTSVPGQTALPDVRP